MNDLSILLNNCAYGCKLNGQSINHIMYADDTVLIAPCPNALQQMIYICEQFAKENDIIFNVKKSKCMVLKSKCSQNYHVSNIFLNCIVYYKV